jgi:hypothetical protein
MAEGFKLGSEDESSGLGMVKRGLMPDLSRDRNSRCSASSQIAAHIQLNLV